MIRSRFRLPAAAVTAVLLATGPARAADAGACDGIGDLKNRPDLAMATVVGAAARVPFVKGASGANGCPSATDACRDRAYLVPGNRVIAGVVRGGFTCVDYVAADGGDRAGWVAAASVVREPDGPVRPADWLGRWVREEAEIAVRPAGGGRLTLHGDATWGAMDPERVKRGGVNIGEFDAVAAPDGGALAFDVGDKATLPVDKGDDADCKLWMRRLGPYLLVDDDNNCGGMNVTFRGIYRKTG